MEYIIKAMPRAMYTKDHNEIVAHLKRARIEAGLVQLEVAEKLGLQVWNLEVGKEDVVDLFSKKFMVAAVTQYKEDEQCGKNSYDVGIIFDSNPAESKSYVEKNGEELRISLFALDIGEIILPDDKLFDFPKSIPYLHSVLTQFRIPYGQNFLKWIGALWL